MTTRNPSLYAAALAGMAISFCQTPPLNAQSATAAPAAAVAPETFDYDLGSRDVSGATYTVKTTQPMDSKLKSQRIRFTTKTSNADGSTTRYFTINTGKFKTVAQLSVYLRETFGKFLSGASANTEVGKVGDIKYGGEIRFVVESSEMLRYDTLTAGEPNASMKLSRAEVMAYNSILAGEVAPKR